MPNDYQGVLEKQNGITRNVNAILPSADAAEPASSPPTMQQRCHAALTPDVTEYPGTFPCWPVMGAPIKASNSFNPVATDDGNDDDDEHDTKDKVLDSPNTWANQNSHANNIMISQKQRRRLKPFEPKPLTKEQMFAISEQIKAGTLSRPILDQCSAANNSARLNLVDSWSAADVANHKQHAPGATVTMSEAWKSGKRSQPQTAALLRIHAK